MTAAGGDQELLQSNQIKLSAVNESAFKYHDEGGKSDSRPIRTFLTHRRRCSKSTSSVNIKDEDQSDDGDAPVKGNPSAVTRTGSLPEVNGLLKCKSNGQLRDFIVLKESSCPKLEQVKAADNCYKNLGDLRMPRVNQERKESDSSSTQTISTLVPPDISTFATQPKINSPPLKSRGILEKEKIMLLIDDYQKNQTTLQEQLRELQQQCQEKEFHMKKMTEQLCKSMVRNTKLEHERTIMQSTVERLSSDQHEKERRLIATEKNLRMTQKDLYEITRKRDKLKKDYQELCATQNTLVESSVAPLHDKINNMKEDRKKLRQKINKLKDLLKGKENRINYTENKLLAHKILLDTLKHVVSPEPCDVTDQFGSALHEQAVDSEERTPEQNYSRRHSIEGNRDEQNSSLHKSKSNTPTERGKSHTRSRSSGSRQRKHVIEDNLENKEKLFRDENSKQDHLFIDDNPEQQDIFSNAEEHSSLLSGPLTFLQSDTVEVSSLFKELVSYDLSGSPNGANDLAEGLLLRKQELDNHFMKARDRSWQYVYVVQRDGCLTFYENKKQEQKEILKDACAVQDLRNAIVTQAVDYSKRKHVFRVRFANGLQYLFQAQDGREMMFWICSMDSASKGKRFLPEGSNLLQPQSGSPGKVDRLHQFIRGGISALAKM
ncbi:uncharacterized protein [Antedon mediterranea]|uniref:uncharacterized protein n=1 Tax=Antedon mediterranea TaxID=105859 RepID=UPI003AF600F8